MTKSVQEQLTELNRIYKEGHDLYSTTAAGLGLSDSALMILYGLSHVKKPCTQKELCEKWYLKKQTLHSALKNLIKMELVYTEPSPKNSRVKLIILTEKGKTLCEQTAIPFLEGEVHAFSRLTPEERDMLVSLTRKHTNFIKEEAEKLLHDFQNRSV